MKTDFWDYNGAFKSSASKRRRYEET